MRKWVAALVLSSSVLFSTNAFAAQLDYLDLRFGLGMVESEPEEFDRAVGSNGGITELGNLTTGNIDLIAKFATLPVGLGLRYEGGGKSVIIQSGSVTSGWDLNATIISAMVNYRFKDDGFFFGPLALLGYPTGDFELTTANVTSKSSLNGKGPSLALGAELGAQGKHWLIGAEAGYQYLEYDSPSNLNAKIDLSGFYGRVNFGYRFILK